MATATEASVVVEHRRLERQSFIDGAGNRGSRTNFKRQSIDNSMLLQSSVANLRNFEDDSSVVITTPNAHFHYEFADLVSLFFMQRQKTFYFTFPFLQTV